MSDFSTTDNDDFGKDSVKTKKIKHIRKKTLSSITNREALYKRGHHFSLGISRLKTYFDNTTLTLNSNKETSILTTVPPIQIPISDNTSKRYDVYGTPITKGGKNHKVSFIDELKQIPIADISEYTELKVNNNSKVTIYKNRSTLYKETKNANDKDVVYCSSCVII